jgi:prephenate dehydratase
MEDGGDGVKQGTASWETPPSSEDALFKVALLGPSTYSEEALKALVQDNPCERVTFRSITDVFVATSTGRTAYSVIPIENTLEGSVHVHLDELIHTYDLPIQAEWTYPIVMDLLMRPAGEDHEQCPSLSHIHTVYSHAVAFTQCKRFIEEQLPDATLESVSSTAEGARKVAFHNDPCVAAIGPAIAAQRYGLVRVHEAIQDHENNVTRFLLLGKKKPPYFRGVHTQNLIKKTTLLLMPQNDEAGGLHQLLSPFAWRKLNLTKIESRPTKRQLGTYFFYVDILASIDSVLLQGAMQELEAIGCPMRLLGSYVSYPLLSESAL